MSIPAIYTEGTISVTNGELAFSGVGTAWSTQLGRGTEINVGGITGTVDTITSDGDGTFIAPWPGDTASGAEYVAKSWTDGVEIAESVRLLIERLIGKGLGVVSPGDPVAADYRDNDLVYSRNSGVLSVKDMGVLRALVAPGDYDAFGDVTNSPSDRDQYDDGQGDLDAAVGRGLTFFSLTETGFYVLLTPATSGIDAVWSDLVSIRGPSGAGAHYTLSAFKAGKPKDAGVLLEHTFEVAVTFPANFAGGYAKAGAASTGAAVVAIKKNGSSAGTATYTASAAGVLATGGVVNFAAGDTISIVAPSPADATLADLHLTLTGTLT